MASKLKASFKIKRLRTIYILYWFLLTYIIAALVWWFIALSQQNKVMTDYKLSEIHPSQPDYQQKAFKINDEKRRKTGQYIGEGVTFLLLIVIGAVIVFRAVRRQFKLSQQQQNFMMAITHELKTPIAVAKLNLETLQKHTLSTEQQQHLISNTLQEAGRLNSLCNNLLLASKIEAGDYQLTTEKINFTELVSESVNDFKMRFPRRDIRFSADNNTDMTGDRLLLQMAVNNLIDNAIKYSSKEEAIEIDLQNKNGQINLLVRDEGKGIPGDEKDKIFNKFYRVGNVHTKEAKGTGLGLYLTKKIIEQHNGRISVRNNTPQGSIFEFNLDYA
jgi:two-component system, OmpR family, sensor histidine kinase CiaH